MKKFLFSLILIISSFMIYNQNVSAQDIYTTTFNKSDYIQGMSNINMGGIWKNTGRGYLLFSVMVYYVGGQANIPSPALNAAYADSNIGNTCEIGTSTSYSDSTSQLLVYSVKCPIELTSRGLQAIYLDFNPPSNGVSWKYQTSYNLSFVKNDAGVDLTSVIQAINALDNHALITDFYNLVSYAFAQLKNDNYENMSGLYTVVNNARDALINALNNLSTAQVNAINSQSQQQHQDAQQAHQDAQDINNSINNNNIDNANSSASTWDGKNASNGVITQLLTLPINLLNAIVNGIQTSCSNFSLGSLFDNEIVLPCINISNYIGSALFTTIDLLISGFMIYNISKKLIKIFNDFTNLKSNQIDEIYGGVS